MRRGKLEGKNIPVSPTGRLASRQHLLFQRLPVSDLFQEELVIQKISVLTFRQLHSNAP